MRYAWNFPDGVNNGVCLLLFVGLCCPFQFYATGLAFLPLLEADFLGLYLGQSAVILEFQGHPGNDILITVISFLKTRIKHKDQAS